MDFQAFPPGKITGEIRRAGTTVVPTRVESEHPYRSNMDETWTIDGGSSATRIRLHFSRLETEPAFDWVLILDENDNVVESYTADYSDIWTPWIGLFRWYADDKEHGSEESMPFSDLHEWMQAKPWNKVV
mgnify:CR=1 FL=1